MCWKSTMGATHASYSSGSARVRRSCDTDLDCAASPASLATAGEWGLHLAGAGLCIVLWVWDLDEPDSLHAEHSLLQSDDRHCTCGAGTVTASPAPNCGSNYAAGTVVKLKQRPIVAMCSRTGVGMPAGRATTVYVTMDGDKVVTANFTGPAVPIAPVSAAGSDELGQHLQLDGGEREPHSYVLEVYDGSNTRILQQWFSASAANCDSETRL